MRFRRGVVLALLAALLTCALGAGTARAAGPLEKVLVFSKTVQFRHDSIPAGIAAIQTLGAQNGFTVDATEDSTKFTDANLAQYDVVVWLSTTGDVLNDAQQAAFERYIKAGGGYAGIHAASDTEYTWPWYGQMLGAYFRNHPAGTPTATVKIEDADAPSTTGIPASWTRADEWYNFQKPNDPVVGGNQAGIPDYSPRTSGVHVLATVDESTYDEVDDSAAADDHPISWCSDFDGGHVWYTGLGHTQATFSEPDFLKHLLGGLKTAAGAVTADCGAPRQSTPTSSDFELKTLAKGVDKTGEPIAMAVLPDRRVLHTSRDGRVWLTTPNATTSLAGTVPVYSHDEEGLQGIAIDPDFATNKWVYVYYSPRLSTPTNDAPSDGTAADFAPYKAYTQLSRIKLTDGGTIDLASEQKILQVPAERGSCCHVGGEIDFDAQGNLFLSTGDDSNPFSSDGYTPIDERSTRNPVFDAQRTAGNTNDLRGKLLRIKVGADGSYTIPAGNLFAAGQMGTRPEVYAMGFRNPFRFAVDRSTGWVYLGDYGPDAGAASATRGPAGQVEFNLIKGPGNYGWPYCTGKNDAYNDYDFATGTSGAKFDCAAPKNTSPNNTGLIDLPPAQSAWIAYDNCSIVAFGCGSESPMGGPTYHYDASNPSTTKFPSYFDGKNFAYEFGRAWIKTLSGGADGSMPAVETFFADFGFKQLINIEFGPDGSLYVLDYGSGGYFTGDVNSAVYRIDYVSGQRSPLAVASADKTSGPAPLTVQFSSEASIDPDGAAVTFAWDFDGDGTTDSTAANPTHTYTTVGRHTATLKVTDPTGQTGNASVNIIAGNTTPTVKITLPPQGAIYDYGDTIKYTITVTDPEDGAIDCTKVRLDTALGHNEHSHGDQNLTGCTGQFTIPAAWEDKTQHSFYVLTASYTDKGVSTPGLELTGTTSVALEHRTQQAEMFDAQSGLTPVTAAAAAGGGRMGYSDPGDWVKFDNINLTGITSVTARTTGVSASRLEFHVDSPTGPLVGAVPVVASGGWEVYKSQDPAPITDPGGTHDLYVVFAQNGMDLDEFTFNGPGAGGNATPVVTASATPLSGAAPLKVDFTSTATDPEGTAVSYEWDFGVAGAPKATTKDASYTYTQRGLYTATLTVKDADGRTAARTFAIEVLGMCPGSDTFGGATLDRNVWTSIVREEAANYKVENGVLTINAVAGDMWTGATTAKNIISRPVPKGPWTATTRVTLAQAQNGEQAAIILRQSDTEFLKLAFIRTAEGRNIEFVGLRSGSDPSVERSTIFPTTAPRTVLLRMISNGTTASVAYSLDGVSWTTVGTPKALDRMTAPQIGISAYNGVGTPASFEWFNLSGTDDEFEGDALNDCRWTTIVRPTAGGIRVTGGELQIDALDGDMYNGTATAKNIVEQAAPAGAWETTTKVKLAQGGAYEQAGLILHKDDKNFAKIVLMDLEGTGWRVEFGQDVNGVASVLDTDRSGALPAGINASGIYLKMTSDGTNITAAWSADGTTWVPFSRARSLASLTGAKIGLAGYHGTGQPARFDFFRLKPAGANTAPVISAATATPSTGTAPLPVQFGVTATDGEGGSLTYAWDLDGNGTVDSTVQNPTFRYTTAGTYVAKVSVSDGELTASKTVTVTVSGASTSTPGDVFGEVPGVLSLQLGGLAMFSPFQAGATRDYTASTTATVISTAADASLTVADPSSTATGHLVNGTYALPRALQVRTGTSAFAPVGSSAAPTSLLSYQGAVGKDVVAIDLKQSISESDALRTGKYGKTLVFTLSTTTP
jgi:cytochrome c